MENLIFTFDRAKELISDEYSCLKLLTTTYEIKLSSSYAGRIKKGIHDHLKSQTNRFVISLGGILVAYKNIHLLENTGTFFNEGRLILLEIQADFIIFAPEVGRTLRGVVNKYGRDYVSCLVHDTFYASIPRPPDENVWIGDSLDIGYEFLFNVTFVEEKYLRGTIIEDSVRVPQDYGEYNEYEENADYAEYTENQNDNEYEENANEKELEVETDDVVASISGVSDKITVGDVGDGGIEPQVNGIDDKTVHKKKKRKYEEMNGVDEIIDQVSHHKKKKRKAEDGGTGENDDSGPSKEISDGSTHEKVKKHKDKKKHKKDKKTKKDKKKKDKERKKHKTKDKEKKERSK